MLFKDMTVGQFMNKLASDAAAPGGGSAAAMAGSMGCSLVSMVANLTVGNQKFKGHEKDVKTILERSEILREKLLTAADEDARAFNAVMDAMKMPRNTDSEKAERAEIMQRAFKGAALKPAEIGDMCLDALKLAWDLHDKGNPNALSDIGVGALMANAGLESALVNVEINLPYIKDEDFTREMKSRVQHLRTEGNKIFRNIMANVRF